MSIPELPNPCPTLQEGLALGAQEHQGFVATWNWIVDFFRNIKNYFVSNVNGRTGKINIVAGSGIDVIAEGDTITIGLGGGNSEDNDNPDGYEENGDGDWDGGNWTDAEPAETSGGEFDAHAGMFEWNSKDGIMGPGGCMVGRTWINAGGTGSKGDGTYSLMVTLTNNGASANVVLGSGTTSDTVCYIPIYTISGGKITQDLRGAFVVPCWE